VAPDAWFLLLVQFLDFMDVSVVNVALPLGPPRLALLAAERAVGDQRLRTRLRRLPAARWATGGDAAF